MKICFNCTKKFDLQGWICPVCSHSPALLNDFFALSPNANAGDHFPEEGFANLADLEANNFWFRARNQIIIWGIRKYFPDIKNFLEIGCGTGYVLSGIEQNFPQLDLSGSEIFTTGLKFAQQKIKNVNLFQMDAQKIPFENEFDLIGAFDVIEHIEKDDLVLSQIYQAVKPGGGIILTVPQHPFLWSYVDEYSHHVRRYTAHELKNKLQAAGFNMVRMTSFVTTLLPLMMLSRFRSKKINYDPVKELNINKNLNFILEKILNFERTLIRSGLNLPFGGSLLAIAKKEMSA